MSKVVNASSGLLLTAIFGLVVPASISGISGSVALAQETDQDEVSEEQSAVDEEAEDRMTVTGTRITRAEFDTSMPAVQIDAEFFNDRGFVNIVDALDETPSFGASVDERGDAEVAEIGLNFANALGLGSSRTLTLIDGKRVVSSNAPTTVDNDRAGPGLQVDLNIIPTLAMERIETIYTGGAPIYGSDAVAGTLNVIMRKDFEGAMFDAQGGLAEDGDKEEGSVRGLWGTNTADGKGNTMVALEYTTIGSVDSSSNDIASRADGFCESPASQGPGDGIPDLEFCQDGNNLFITPNTGLPMRLIDPATGEVVSTSLFDGDGNRLRVFADEAFDTDANLLRDADGNPLVFGLDGSLITFDEANFGRRVGRTRTQGANGFTNPIVSDTQRFNALVGEKDRWNMYAKSHYEIVDGIRWSGEALYSRLEANNVQEQPRFMSDVFGNNQLRPAIAVNITDNPFVSDQVKQVLQDNDVYNPDLVDENGDPVDQFFKVARSNFDIEGKTPFFRTQDTFRFVTGFDGDLEVLGSPWRWDASMIYGESNASSRTSQIDAERFQFALDAVTDPETGEPVCRVQVEGFQDPFENTQPGSGRRTAIDQCVPFNPLGFNPINDEQRAYLIQPETRETKLKQIVYEANIGGPLLELPAGTLEFFGGVTHRREDGSFRGDRTSRNALTESGPILDVAGDFDTVEFYGEALVPVVRNGEGLPFDLPIDMFEIEGAIRSVDNSIAGKDTTWTLGGRLRPILPGIGDGLTLRGNITEAIRSPAIPELFLPRSTIRVFANDPCDQDFLQSGPNPDVRLANCQAAAPADLDLANFDSTIQTSRREGVTGGNPNLDNEKSESWTIGGILSPSFLPGLTLSVDWTDITVKDAIVQLSATDIMTACFDSTSFPNTPACSNFQRNDRFQVSFIETGFVNAAELRFAGLLSNINYTFAAADLPFVDSDLPGRFQLFGNFFHINTLEREIGTGDLDILAGEAFNEKFEFQLNLRYDTGKYGFLWQTRHIGSHVFDAQESPERRPANQSKVDPMRIHNLTFNYQINDYLRARVVVNNVFDNRDDPLRAASLGGNDLAFTDPFGRRYLFGLRAEF